MVGPITDITDDHLILIDIELTNKAELAIVTEPGSPANDLFTERGRAAFRMECFPALGTS